MVGEYKYKNIDQVIAAIRLQIIDSVEWCYNNIPVMDSPRELYKYLKARTTFKDDPPDVELIQTAQTLFENNYHGKSGHGDCDCFTVTVTAAMIAQGWGYMDIMLGGKNTQNPVHIYNKIDFNGTLYTFDLTQPWFNDERYYRYYETIPVKFNK